MAGSLDTLKVLYVERPDQFELLRETCVKVLRQCGHWAATECLANLAVMQTKAKCLCDLEGGQSNQQLARNRLNLDSITVASLAPCSFHAPLSSICYLEIQERERLSVECAASRASIVDFFLPHVADFVEVDDDGTYILLNSVSLMLQDIHMFCTCQVPP